MYFNYGEQNNAISAPITLINPKGMENTEGCYIISSDEEFMIKREKPAD